MKREKLGIWGLVLSSIGALISSVSITEYYGSSFTSPLSNIQYHPAFISGIGFKIGLYLLVLGFSFQIVERIYKDKYIPENKVNIVLIVVAIIYFILLILLPKLFFI